MLQPRFRGLVSRAGSDDFMFDFQTRGRSRMTQGGREGTIQPGYGVLYDARRPFEDSLDGPGQQAEVLIATVPAAALLDAIPNAERLCAIPIPLAESDCARDHDTGARGGRAGRAY